MKKTATLCCKIFDLLYGWNAFQGVLRNSIRAGRIFFRS